MRARQISPKAAKSVESPLRLIAVPIRCHCIAPVREDRYQHFTNTLAVRINGLVIENAVIKVLSYLENGRYAKVEFSGTLAIFATGIEPAIAAARLPQIEFAGWVEGQARELQIEIVGEVVMMTPVDGRLYSLIGADR
mgnify:CR=1 FL=1